MYVKEREYITIINIICEVLTLQPDYSNQSISHGELKILNDSRQNILPYCEEGLMCYHYVRFANFIILDCVYII